MLTTPDTLGYAEVPGPPYHDFWLCTNDYAMPEYRAFLNQQSSVRISDTLIYYFYDSLLWIPTRNPATPDVSHGYGLNLYGPTIITQTGAIQFHDICAAWARLLCIGPETLVLSAGPIGIPKEDDTYDWKIQKLHVDRDALVHTFNTLVDYAHMVLAGTHYILHLGV